MTTKLVTLCDLCLSDGNQVVAKAIYWNDEGDKWHACSKHLRDIIAVGLKYELLEEANE